MAFSLGEYQDIFLEEADEQLQELNQNLLELEKNQEDLDIINNIFRAAHSLKSSAAFVGLNDLSDLAHNMENLLQGIRDQTMQVGPEIIDVLFSCFDMISSVIDTVAEGREPEADLSEINERIKNLNYSKGASIKRSSTAAEQPKPEVQKIKLKSQQVRMIRDGMQRGRQSCFEITVYIHPNAQMKWIKAMLVVQNLQRLGSIVASLPEQDDINENTIKDNFSIITLSDRSTEDIKAACDVDQIIRVDLRKISLSKMDEKTVLTFHGRETIIDEKPSGGSSANTAHGSLKEKDYDEDYEDDEEQFRVETFKRKDDKKTHSLKIVKVSVDKLDQLLNNVGELVIANSGFFKLYEELRKETFEKGITNEFKNRMDQMSRIAKDLQNGIMKTRMVPIGQVFSRFNRLVRDLGKEFKKNVVLVTKGEETELDKKVIDSIGEPLMHLIRNGIDHGIESPEERKRLGKPEIATITLNAHQAGNQIFVSVVDDGRGIDIEKVKKKVITRGLATPEMIANMDTEDVLNYIYSPGFSTADVVTDISGRGVGMNVVKEIVSELNGSVSIETETGMGTRFVMAFPLTLAIIPAIMVKVTSELYAVPLSDVIETIKISFEDITTIEGHEVINLRGEILSLLRLSDFVGIEETISEDAKIPVVVVGYGNRKIGLIVDYLEGKQEIVIKPLEQNYATVEGLSGASILGDGSICLILDVSSMINKVISDQDKLAKRRRMGARQVKEATVETVIVKEKEPFENMFKTKQKESLDSRGTAPEVVAGMGAAEQGADIKEDVIFKKEEEIVPPGAKIPEYERAEHGIEERPSGAASHLDEENIEKKVRETLKSFKEELVKSVRSTVETGSPDDHIKKQLNMTELDIIKIQELANTGVAQAAESLSKILNKRIDLSIPSVTLHPVEQIPASIGDVDTTYIGVYMPLIGDLKGTILFGLRDESGFDLIDILYGIERGETKELNEDGESALKEVTNIIGSSVINVIAEKSHIAIKPDVPTVVHDYMQSILDSLLILHNFSSDYALVMETVFYHQDDSVIGELLVIPEPESLKMILSKLD